jgi:hypothetical protein
MGLRGKAELIETSPRTERAWVRPGVGVGYTDEEADELAQQVVVAEVLEFRSHQSVAAMLWPG